MPLSNLYSAGSEPHPEGTRQEQPAEGKQVAQEKWVYFSLHVGGTYNTLHAWTGDKKQRILFIIVPMMW